MGYLGGSQSNAQSVRMNNRSYEIRYNISYDYEKSTRTKRRIF